MKYLSILAMLFLTACASTNNSEKTSGTPNYSTGYTRALGTGQTVDEAKANAINLAIEMVVGSVILSLKESDNNRLNRDEIIKHSAGYVDDYKVVSQTSSATGVTMVLDVNVKSSKIANKLLSKQGAVTDMQGDKVIGLYNSFLNERATGDKFIETVIESYLRDGYIVTPGRIDVSVDAKRNMVIYVPVKAKMNQNWVKSFMEALSVVESGNNKSPSYITVTYKNSENDWLQKGRTFNFNDTVRHKKIMGKIGMPFYINAKILDKNNNVIFEQCYGENGKAYIQGYNFSGDYVIDTDFLITVPEKSKLHKDLQAMDKIVFRMSNCRHLNTYHRYLKDFVAD